MTKKKKEVEVFLSKSSIETFNQCGLKFDYRYIQKTYGEQALSDKQAALFGTLIHEVLERYFENKKKDELIVLYKHAFEQSELGSDEFYNLGERLLHDYAADVDNGNKILEVEKDFKLYLDNGVPIKGFIDRIDEISEDEIEIIDYKTGYSLPLTPKQLESDLQLGMYNLAANALYPKYKKVKISLYYLHYGKVSCYRTPEQLDTLKNYLSVTYNKIMAAINSGKELTPRVNSFCSFCDYKKTCSKFKAVVLDPEDANQTEVDYKGLIAPETGMIINHDTLDQFLKTVQAKSKILKKVEYQIKDYMKTYVKENGGEDKRATIGKTSYSINAKKYTIYNVATVLELCQEKGIHPSIILSAKKTDVDKLFKGDEESMKRLQATARINYSDPYIR